MKMKCTYFCSLRTTEEVNIRFRQMILNRVRSFQKILFTNESMCTNNIISIGLQTNIHFLCAISLFARSFSSLLLML